jgi:hypothetical protein
MKWSALLSLFAVLLLVLSIPLGSPPSARAEARTWAADCICKTQNGYINVFFYNRPADKVPAFGTSVLATAQGCKYTSACGSGSNIVGTVRFTLDGHREDTTYVYKFSMYGQEQR